MCVNATTLCSGETLGTGGEESQPLWTSGFTSLLWAHHHCPPQAECARHPSTAMAQVSINELPENILLELFTHVPARQLLLRCRPVCSLWRDLIDLVTLWKRKCLRDGFVTEDWDQPVADWKIFYFLCSLRRNLLRNPCAEGGRG